MTYISTIPRPGGCPSCDSFQTKHRLEGGGKVFMIRITHQPDCAALAARRIGGGE